MSEMRRNLDRFELERDLDRRHHAGESFYDGPSGRSFRGGEDMDRFVSCFSYDERYACALEKQTVARSGFSVVRSVCSA